MSANYHGGCGCGCNSTPQPKFGGCKGECPLGIISTRCIKYNGVDLENSGYGDNTYINTIIEQFDKLLGEILLQLEEEGTLTNIGDGAGIFAGFDSDTNTGQLKSLMGSDSIDVIDSAETITFEISDEYIEGLLTPIQDIIDNLQEGQGDLTDRVTALEDQQAINISNITNLQNDLTIAEADIVDIKNDIVDVKSEILVVTDNLDNLQERVAVNEVNIANLQSTQDDILDTLDALEKVKIVREDYTGQGSSFTLQQTAVEVLEVFYQMQSLPLTLWSLDTTTNRVIINLTSADLTVDMTDPVTVVYKVATV